MRKVDGRNGGGPSQPEDTLRVTADATSPVHWTGVGRQECWESTEEGRVPGARGRADRSGLGDEATGGGYTTEAGHGKPCPAPGPEEVQWCRRLNITQ